MSDIIIEGKNLNDLNQSNFQTVGPKGRFYFTRNGFYADYKPQNWQMVEPSTDDFYHDSVENHAFNRSLSPSEFSPFYEALRYTAVEPWQGRLEHTREILNRANEGISSIFPVRKFDGHPAQNPQLPGANNSTFGNYLYYNLFYLNNLIEFNDYNQSSETRWDASDGTWDFGLNLHNVNENFLKINNSGRLGVEPRFNTSNNPKYFFMTDNRFSLGTYTENNKQYWELQTTNPQTRQSQFSLTKMKTAFASKVNNNIIRSEEEEFSVDTFVFTEREGKTTPLCFYYDKKLHHDRYNLASTGKVMMKIELRESGRDTLNNVDLFKVREPIRPFLLGFIADEQDGAVGNQIFGEGLYLFNQQVTLTAIANEENYLLGIYNLDNVLLSQGTGAGTEYTLVMPKEDVQYEARFRPNPLVRFNTRDEGIVRVNGDEDAKAEIRLWRSSIIYDNDETEYYTDAPQGESRGDFAPIGTTVEDFTLRPSTSDTDIYTVEYRTLTDNYKFRGWSYLSGSESTPTELPRLANINADEEYGYWTSTPPGSDETNIRTFKLTQDFRYPNGVFQIYADFALIKFAIENLNNNVDFENNFAEALKYGPFKFATALGGVFNGVPTPDAYRFDNVTSFPAYSSDESNVRLYIAGPGMGYVNTPTTPPIEEEPIEMPDGWSPVNPLIGTLSPFGQWIWNGGAWEENPNYDPSDYQSFSDYLPSGDYGHLTPIEETGFDFGAFFWHKHLGNETKIEGEPTTIPNTLQTAINIAGEYPPTYNSAGNNMQLSGTANSPSPNYDVGDTAGPGGIFKVTEVTLDQAGSENGNYFWDVDWGPNLSDSQLSNESALYELSGNEFEFKGIELRGDLGDDDLLSSFEINQIISTETTSSISYQPLQRGVYVKVIDDGAISTSIDRSTLNSMTPIRTKELSGAIDADMEGFGRSVVYNLTPSMASMPPQIQAYVVHPVNGNLTLTTDIFPSLTNEVLGIEWNPDDWHPNGGGTIKYTAPESRDAADAVYSPLFWKYIEIRVSTHETAEGEQSESGEAVDSNFHVGLNIFSMPGSGGQIYDDETGVLLSTGGLVDLFAIVDYPNWDEIPVTQRRVILRAVPSAGSFSSIDDVGEFSFLADPGQDIDDLGIINQSILNDDGHHIGIITLNQPGPITVKYAWFPEDESGGGP